jgi:Flp pilus assembly protein TadB
MCWTSPYTRHKTRKNKQSKKHSTTSSCVLWVWWCPTHIVLCFLLCLFVLVLCLVYGNVQHILRYVICFACFSSSFVLCMVMSKNIAQYVLDITIPTRHKKRTNKQSKKHSTICVGHHHTQDTRRGKTNKAKNITQYVLDNTIHKTQDEDKHILCYVFCFVCLSSSCVLWVWWCPTHIVLCFWLCLFVLVLCLVGMVMSNTYWRHKTRKNKQSKKYSTICVGHHHTQDTGRGKTSKAKNIAQYVLDITIPTRHKTRTNKQSKKHSTICCPTHIVLCFLLCLFVLVLCLVGMVMSNTYCAMFFALFVCHRLVSCVYGDVLGHHHTQDTRRGKKTKQKT